MLLLRCTRWLLSDVQRHLPMAGARDASTTRLGDWFANRLNVAQQRYVIALSATTLLPVIVPARDPATLPQRITESVTTLLRLIGVPESVLAGEVGQMEPVRVAPTNDPSVTASLNHAAQRGYQELYDLPHRPGRTLDHINLLLARAPLATLDHDAPAEAVLARLCRRS